jgi:hypothetical protein
MQDLKGAKTLRPDGECEGIDRVASFSLSLRERRWPNSMRTGFDRQAAFAASEKSLSFANCDLSNCTPMFLQPLRSRRCSSHMARRSSPQLSLVRNPFGNRG